VRTQSGEIRWIEDMSKCIEDESGVINHVEGILLDITERKAMEEALKASEQRYRLLVENVNAHISLIDSAGKFLFINEFGARAHGRNQEDFIGRHLSDLFPPSVVENQMRAIRAVIATGEEKNTRMEVKIGVEWRWFDVNLQPCREAEESGMVVMIIATDITENLKADEALRAREEQYRMLIDNVQADIVLVDHDGIFLFVNGSSARNMGYSPEEIIGKSQHDIFPSENADRQLKNIREVIESGRGFQEEVNITLGGKRRWLDINIQPYRDHDGQATSAMIIAIDITNRKEAERALMESEERFRLQFTSLPIAAYIWEYTSDDFVLTDFNLAAVEITRGGIGRFIGNKLSEMYGDAPEIIEDMFRCFKEKATITREMPYHMVSTGEDKYLRLFYVYVPPNLVVAHTEDITESYHAREALQRAHDDLEIRVRQRTSELADANEALQVEREALQQKNIALREVLDQIEAGKRQMAAQIQSNINRIVLPILKSLESKTAPAGRHYTELLRTSLDDIASPLISTLETRFARLTPRELEVCNMVRNGLSSKDIAEIFHTSVQTVLKQRTIIRKKLGLTGRQTNLASYLKSLE
jgi:PAS domain S-box-containing protein